jgi:hypothetical protein
VPFPAPSKGALRRAPEFLNRILSIAALCTAVLLTRFPSPVLAQLPDADALRVFLDCEDSLCDVEHVQREVGFVSYVRDRRDADVHVLITGQPTAGGGTKFTLAFLGQGRHRDRNDQLQHITPPDATEATAREGLTKMIAVGLLPYAADTPALGDVEIAYRPVEGRTEPAPDNDHWNHWILNSWMNGEFEEEEQMHFFFISGGQTASRITASHKLSLALSAEYIESRFDIPEQATVTTLMRSYGLDGLYVRSLGPNWSAGVQGSAQSSEFENYDLAIRFAPAVEFNLFPYDESTRRELRLLYSVGARSLNYREETIFLRHAETVYDQRLTIAFERTEPWGSADVALEGSHLLREVERNRVVLYGLLDVRLLRGLSLRATGSASRIRDQINLPRGGATAEEILLRQRELQTSFRLSGSLGLSYTFGSSFSEVVNPRFGT